VRRRRRRVLRWLLWGAGVLVLGAVVSMAVLLWTLPDVRPLATQNPKTTAFIELRREQARRAGKKFQLRWSWRSLARISPYLRHAVVHAEDGKFWKHEGVDWDALEKAAEKNWEEGRFASGGSTITQQVAKNLYLSPSKNPVRKLREILIARRLEEHLPKKRILEIYLNIAEWGDGVFGAEAAARAWYGVSAADLSPVQAARLAVALPNPFRRSPAVRSRELDRKAARLVRAMRRDGLIDEATYQAALVELGIKAPAPAPPPEASTVPAVPPDPDPVPAAPPP
jgi:monofunctional biosynthetic peptidoglycan transglycosylase